MYGIFANVWVLLWVHVGRFTTNSQHWPRNLQVHNHWSFSTLKFPSRPVDFCFYKIAALNLKHYNPKNHKKVIRNKSLHIATRIREYNNKYTCAVIEVAHTASDLTATSWSLSKLVVSTPPKNMSQRKPDPSSTSQPDPSSTSQIQYMETLGPLTANLPGPVRSTPPQRL